MTPSTDHEPGMNITLELILTNSNSEPCYIDLVDFFYSPQGSGQNEQWFHTEFYDKTLAPGEQDVISTEYTVPIGGAGNLIARFNTDCCRSETSVMTSSGFDLHCTGDIQYCYEFTIFISGTPQVNSLSRIEYIPATWPFEILHWPAGPFPITDLDSIVYQICTVSDASLGSSASIYTVIHEEGRAKPLVTRNRVLITPQTGDCNGDCLINISDAVYLIQYIFAGGDPPLPEQSCDVNCSGLVNISDAVFIISYIFGGGPEPCLVNPYFDK